MRGSPIRKSSDQRSVDSSPRLIAASYVLHRLLVPRHPPCALNNLATQKHRNRTPGRKHCCGPTRTLRTESKRCSRPLCSSQRTTRHRPPDPAEPTAARRRDGGTRNRPALQRSPVPPEGRARSLRTQQRAYDPGAPPDPVPHATAVTPYWEPAEAGGRTGQRSTLEHHPEHSVIRR